jgi:hypothetical protein
MLTDCEQTPFDMHIWVCHSCILLQFFRDLLATTDQSKQQSMRAMLICEALLSTSLSETVIDIRIQTV